MDKDTALQQCRKQLALASNSVRNAMEHATKAQKLANAMRGDFSEVETRAVAAGNNCEDAAKAIKRIDSHIDAFFALEPEPVEVKSKNDEHWSDKLNTALDLAIVFFQNLPGYLEKTSNDAISVRAEIANLAAAVDKAKVIPEPSPRPPAVRDLVYDAEAFIRRAHDLARINQLDFSDEKRSLIACIESLDG